MTYTLNAKKGWRNDDDGAIPKLVLDHLEQQRQLGNPGGPLLVSRIRSAGGEVVESVVELSSNLPQVLDDVGWFLTEVRKPGVLGGDMTYMHPKARRPPTDVPSSSAVRPAPVRLSGGDTLAAFDVFVNSIADSLHPIPPWASCEWAVLEVTPAK